MATKKTTRKTTRKKITSEKPTSDNPLLVHVQNQKKRERAERQKKELLDSVASWFDDITRLSLNREAENISKISILAKTSYSDLEFNVVVEHRPYEKTVY